MTAAAPSPVPVDQDTLRSVAAGAYYDPHGVLGPHVGDGAVTIRTLRPLADRVVVVTADGSVEAQHEVDGIWYALLPGTDVPDYRVEVTYDTWTTVVDDPYRFLPTVQELKGGSTVTVARLSFDTLRQAIESLDVDDKDVMLARVASAEQRIDAAGSSEKPEPRRRGR